jgi:hypothetical protein
MSKKKTMIKAIAEMNITLLDVVLDDDRAYMDVSKELFLKKLNNEFEDLKGNGINKFEIIKKGTCASCYKGCGGYTFLTKNNDFLDLLFIENNNEIEDLFLCSEFINEEKLQKNNHIYFSFKEDEKENFNPTIELVNKQQEIKKAENEFKKFENTITDIELIISWFHKYEKFYNSIDIYEKLNYNFIASFSSIFINVSNIYDIIKFNSMASKAMSEFEKIKRENKFGIIDWLIKYENNELYVFYGYEILDNWKTNNLIKLINSEYENVVIDIKEYKQSIGFASTYSDLYYSYMEEYHPTKEIFETYGSFGGDLSELLSARNIFPEILKKYNIKPKEKTTKTTANKV